MRTAGVPILLLAIALPASGETDAEFLKRTGQPRQRLTEEEYLGAYREVGGKRIPLPPREHKRQLLAALDNRMDTLQESLVKRVNSVGVIIDLAEIVPDGAERPVFEACIAEDPVPALRAGCARAMGILDIKKSKGRLRKRLAAEVHPEVKLALAEALVNIGDKRAPGIYSGMGAILAREDAEGWEVGPMERTVGEWSPEELRARRIEQYRVRAAKILARADAKKAKPILKNYRKDENPEVRAIVASL